MKRIAWTLLLLVVTPLVMAQTQDQTRDRMQDQTRSQTQDRTRDRIYGSQLMTPAERATYRQRIRSAKTQRERNRIRAEHHKLMQERARQRGVTLPNMPAQPMHQGMQGQGRNTMPSRKGGGRPGR